MSIQNINCTLLRMDVLRRSNIIFLPFQNFHKSFQYKVITMRKRLVNKEKFEFNEEDVLPPAPQKMMGKPKSMQSRLCKKADGISINNPSQMGAVASSISSQEQSRGNNQFQSQNFSTPTYKYKIPIGVNNNNDRVKFQKKDAILQQIHDDEMMIPLHHQVAKDDPVLNNIVAKLKAGFDGGSFSGGSVHSGDGDSSNNHLMRLRKPKEDPGCVCERPLRLIMCGKCGATTTGRISIQCSIHPRAVFLQDLKNCTSCKLVGAEALKEFDLPSGLKEALGEVGKK